MALTPSDLLMIVGPNVPFLLQYLQTYRSKDSSGFSNLLCFFLILANMLRVFWWAIDPSLSLTVLAAAIIALVCQVTLLELTIRLRKSVKV